MSISVGDRLPEATFLRVGPEGPEQVSLSERTSGRKVIVFAVPAAFSSTCSEKHIPSYVRTMEALAQKGIDEIICVSVNDPFVMKAWAEASGAEAAGITLLADADGAFTAAMGRNFDAPPVGFYGRSERYAMIVEDGVVRALDIEENPGMAEVSSGEAMLEKV